MSWKGLKLTVDGQHALSAAQAAQKLKIKSIVVGDGNLTGDPYELTGLVNQLYEIEALEIMLKDVMCIITAELPEKEYPYYFREIGVTVETEEGVKLYAYDNCGEEAQQVFPSTGNAAVRRRVRLTLMVANVAEVTVTNPAVMYVTYDAFQEALGKKVDAEDGKVLSSNDYTDQDKEAVDGLQRALEGKVDAEAGKALSSNDYTDQDKEAVDGLSGLKFGQDADGNWGYTAPDADEVVPFGSMGASKDIYGDGAVSLGRKNGSEVGENSFAFGYMDLVASGIGAHAEGSYNTASGNYAHSEGYHNTASGSYSHAEGMDTVAVGENGAHAEGSQTSAEGLAAHAEGYNTIARGSYSHAEGAFTVASNRLSHVCGKYNAQMSGSGTLENTTGHAFVIGNGTGNNALSNSFSVMFNGTVKSASTFTASTTADYAEYFEWLDGNPAFEDRVGLFVTMDGEKIKIASPGDSYILGIVSGEPFVLGNGDCDVWNGMVMRDDFNRVIYERAPLMEPVEILDGEGVPQSIEWRPVLDADGKQLYKGTRPKINLDYNPDEPYVGRADRPEWAPVGMLGVLSVRQDGTCKVNGYCTCGEGGVATACEAGDKNSYRVIKVISDQVVKVVFR